MQHRTAPSPMEHGIHIGSEQLQLWVEEVSTRVSLAEIAVAAAFLTILGWSTFAFQKALQNYQVVGSSFF